MAHYIKEESEKELNKLKINKEERKLKKLSLDLIYGYALVDGYLEKVGNYNVEPPTLFRGEIEHPKKGCLKRRILPEDITINIGLNETIPTPPKGHHWKGIVHNKKVTWLCYWKDPVNEKQVKYVYLHASSRFKTQNDLLKYEKARQLKKYINKIRLNYELDIKLYKNNIICQRAVALYLVDFLALRAGSEKI